MAVCSRGLPAALSAQPCLAPPRAVQPPRSRRRRRCVAPARALLDAASLQLAAEPALDALGAVWPQALLLSYLFAPPGPLFGLVDYYALRPLDDARTRAKLRAELFDEGSWTALVRRSKALTPHRSTPRPARAPLQGASTAACGQRDSRPARRARSRHPARFGARSHAKRGARCSSLTALCLLAPALPRARATSARSSCPRCAPRLARRRLSASAPAWC